MEQPITSPEELNGTLAGLKDHLRIIKWYGANEGRSAWISVYADDTAMQALNARGIVTRELTKEYRAATAMYDYTGYGHIVASEMMELIYGGKGEMNVAIGDLNLPSMPKNLRHMADGSRGAGRG